MKFINKLEKSLKNKDEFLNNINNFKVLRKLLKENEKFNNSRNIISSNPSVFEESCFNGEIPILFVSILVLELLSLAFFKDSTFDLLNMITLLKSIDKPGLIIPFIFWILAHITLIFLIFSFYKNGMISFLKKETVENKEYLYKFLTKYMTEEQNKFLKKTIEDKPINLELNTNVVDNELKKVNKKRL